MKLIFKIVIIFILAIGVVYYLSFNNQAMESSQLVDIAINMERDLGVEDVVINENEIGILEVQVKAPDDVNNETLAAGAAYIFGYLEPNLDSGIQKIRVIFTVNNLSIFSFETMVSDISLWINKKIDDNSFASRIKSFDLKR